MTAVITRQFHPNLANSVYNDIQSKSSIYHYFIGKALTWVDEQNPEAPNSYQSYEYDTRKNIIQTKQIQLNDVSLVIPRIDWFGGTVYDMFDDTISPDNPSSSGETSLDESKFYVLTSEFNVYKCIFNNNGAASTIEPTGTGYNYIETGDGYIWKFMSFIPLGARNKFMTEAFMPISTSVKNQYYSGGSIIGYNILDGGQDYDPSETYLVIQGNGSGPSSKALSSIITYNVEFKNGTNSFGSGNKFYLDNQVSPAIRLIEGNTYRFEQSDTTNLGETIKFSTVSDGENNSGSEYTLGVTYVGTPGTSGAYTEITPGEGIVDLYYYSSNTSGAGNLAETIFTAGKDGQADIDLVIEDGSISSLIINDGGYGYTDATALVTKGPGDPGSGASITFNLSPGDLNTQQANVELLAVDGSLSHIVISNPGINYSSPVVNISGDGSGAIAEATTNANGEINKITITNYGRGYTFANVEISDAAATGSGAATRAIISPLGGHGSNAPAEFFADILCFYGTFENEKVLGYNIDNDYRQIGIIKNLGEYNNRHKKFNSNIGLGCFILNGTFDANVFENDSTLFNSDLSKSFRTVYIEDNVMIVTHLTGSIPVIGDVITDGATNSFTVTSVTDPNVNKFSGEMLYIDNKLAFTPSDQQFVVFRTFIKF